MFKVSAEGLERSIRESIDNVRSIPIVTEEQWAICEVDGVQVQIRVTNDLDDFLEIVPGLAELGEEIG